MPLCLSTSAVPPLRASGLPLESLREEPGVYAIQQRDGLHLKLPLGQTGPVATCGPVVVQETGIYLVKVKYRPTGFVDLSLRASSSVDFSDPPQRCLCHLEDDLPVRFLELQLKAEEPIEIQLLNQCASENDGASIVVQDISIWHEKYPLWQW